VNRTICATGTFDVHTSDARRFVGAPYCGLRTRSNKLCCQQTHQEKSQCIVAYKKANNQKMELKLRTLCLWKHFNWRHWARYTTETSTTNLL